jgi:hypothetical protein
LRALVMTVWPVISSTAAVTATFLRAFTMIAWPA